VTRSAGLWRPARHNKDPLRVSPPSLRKKPPGLLKNLGKPREKEGSGVSCHIEARGSHQKRSVLLATPKVKG